MPLLGAVSVARTVAAGELTSHIDIRGSDETADLLRALNDMNASLVSTVAEVRGSTETISVASRQIASGNVGEDARSPVALLYRMASNLLIDQARSAHVGG